MSVFSRLYTGTGAFDIVGRRKLWYTAFGLLVLVCLASMVFRGFNLGIDFTGGTQIQFPANTATAPATVPAVQEVFQTSTGIEPASVQTVGTGPAASVLVRSETLSLAQTVTVKQALFDAFGPRGADGVPSPNVISISAVSGSWGGQITQQALIALAVFLVLVTLFLAFYFERAMAAAALVALIHDVVVTMGVYSIIGCEVTPATVIGLLTILGFSLYDTVVVFDKVKENTRGLLGLTRRTYAEAANLALNQTLMRSINTSLIAVLPVVGLLIVGVGVLGVGTLADLALVQLVGILAGALSSLLLATPLLVDIKMRDRRFQEQAARVVARRQRAKPAPAAPTEPTAEDEMEPDLSDDAELARQLRRERAVAAAASAPARAGKGAHAGGAPGPPARRLGPPASGTGDRTGDRGRGRGRGTGSRARPGSRPRRSGLPVARRVVPRHHTGVGRRRRVHDRGHRTGDVGGRGRRRRRDRGARVPPRRGGGAGGGHRRGAGAQAREAAARRRVPHVRPGVRHRDAGAARGHRLGRCPRVRRRRRARHGWHRGGHLCVAGRRGRRGGRRRRVAGARRPRWTRSAELVAGAGGARHLSGACEANIGAVATILGTWSSPPYDLADHHHGTCSGRDTGGGALGMTDLQPAAPPVPGPDGSRPSATRRVRARLARRMTPARVAAVPPVLEPLASVHRTLHPKADLGLLTAAYEVADAKHAGQKRKSGDPYITHPLAVSTILAELGMDTTTLVAALLHDTVEDTDYSLDRLREEFGDEVAHLVDGVTKLDKVEFGNAAEAETIRKMVVAMARDPRVLVIKLSDRLHNMRTMRFLSPEKQAKKARETLEVMAPLAHRLGMATVKWELEDLSFAILHPKKYSEIVRLVATRAPSRDTYLKQVIDEVRQQLDAARLINVSVEGRPKHYYSIYRKMIVKGRDFDDIHDLVGVRVLVDEVRDCYAAIGMVHALWQPMPGRFKDYIAQPRFGVYQSLHTTVIGPDGKPLEVQIRTHDMHNTAEYGIAAHWRYKETPRTQRHGERRDRRDVVDAPAARLAAGGRRPRRLPGVAALRPGRPARSSCSRRRAT